MAPVQHNPPPQFMPSPGGSSQTYPVTFYEKPLGFNVMQRDVGCYVKKSKNANVLEGSRVLEVNGVDVRGLENSQLRGTLRAAALPISILFAIPEAGFSVQSPVYQPGVAEEPLSPSQSFGYKQAKTKSINPASWNLFGSCMDDGDNGWVKPVAEGGTDLDTQVGLETKYTNSQGFASRIKSLRNGTLYKDYPQTTQVGNIGCDMHLVNEIAKPYNMPLMRKLASGCTGVDSVDYDDNDATYGGQLSTEPVRLTIDSIGSAGLGMKIRADEGGAVTVTAVQAGSAADEAGVRQGDMITGLNDTELSYFLPSPIDVLDVTKKLNSLLAYNPLAINILRPVAYPVKGVRKGGFSAGPTLDEFKTPASPQTAVIVPSDTPMMPLGIFGCAKLGCLPVLEHNEWQLNSPNAAPGPLPNGKVAYCVGTTQQQTYHPRKPRRVVFTNTGFGMMVQGDERAEVGIRVINLWHQGEAAVKGVQLGDRITGVNDTQLEEVMNCSTDTAELSALFEWLLKQSKMDNKLVVNFNDSGMSLMPPPAPVEEEVEEEDEDDDLHRSKHNQVENTINFDTIPGPPSDVNVEQGDSQTVDGDLVIKFGAPSDDGGAVVTSYNVRCSSHPLDVDEVTTYREGSILVSGLKRGEEYSFTVCAVNSEGEGPPALSTSILLGQSGSAKKPSPVKQQPIVPVEDESLTKFKNIMQEGIEVVKFHSSTSAFSLYKSEKRVLYMTGDGDHLVLAKSKKDKKNKKEMLLSQIDWIHSDAQHPMRAIIMEIGGTKKSSTALQLPNHEIRDVVVEKLTQLIDIAKKAENH
jgi:hypothetical protein